MGLDAIVETLAARLSQLANADEDKTLDASALPITDRAAASAIVRQLMYEALKNGLTLEHGASKFQELAGGNTAMQVSIASAEVEFVFKMDLNPKLIREARTIEDLRSDVRLGTFCSRLPKVYSQHAEGPRYAYLMEWFDGKIYPSIKQIFFADRNDLPSEGHASQIVLHAIDALAEAYRASRDPRMQVRMMGEAYYDRIQNGLAKAAEQRDEFKPLPLRVNGQNVLSWKHCLDVIKQHEQEFQSLAAPFVTVVHGDSNPGNILVRRSGDAIRDIKFIDLKDWKYGDYLFDIAKLSHFLLHTGPLEELEGFDNESVEITAEDVHFQFQRTLFPHVKAAAETIERQTAELAGELHDPQWALRYNLAMASNLLGLIPGRLVSARVSEARILYAEGMLLLDQFITNWQSAGFGQNHD